MKKWISPVTVKNRKLHRLFGRKQEVQCFILLLLSKVSYDNEQ